MSPEIEDRRSAKRNIDVIRRVRPDFGGLYLESAEGIRSALPHEDQPGETMKLVEKIADIRRANEDDAPLTEASLEQLKQLAELHKVGVLTDEEFVEQKARVLRSETEVGS